MNSNETKNGPPSETNNYSGPSGMDVSGTIESDWNEVVDNFDEMNLKEELLRGIYAYGYEKPTAIQQRAILPCIKGHDVIAQAQYGTGKTVTFSISILQRIDISLNECQALILAPTRELVKQIQKMVIALGYFMKVDCHACIGGTKIRDDMRKLDTGSHVVVGTLGRVYDMIARKSLRTQFIKIFVLNEVNEMLSQGFERKYQIKEVFKFLEKDIQVIKLSSTIREDVLNVSTHFMRKPIRILVQNEELILKDIKQFYINVTKEEWKFDTLCDLFDTLSFTQVVIFCNTHRKVEWLAENMHLKTFIVSAMHKGMSQRRCKLIMRQFNSGASRVLITTDYFARSNFCGVSAVINYNLPSNRENYIYRVKRWYSGRYRATINFITDDDKRTMKDIESYYNTQVLDMPQDMTDFL
ncbi:unnamed protein product [Aphis gossypii]|uniref:RNA helicase n=1 Tax=Aphis gossypii TaxID=80765 RepID=A0A9P0ILH9_APHGO|nr:unnamed protein product [Aphis gossypii]